MSIKYKVGKRAQAGKKGGGTIRYHAIATQREQVDFRTIAHMLSSRCTLRPADIMAVLVGLSEVIPELILDGKSVKLDNVGIISASIHSEGLESPELVTAASINGLKLHFLPDKEIKRQLRVCDFRKAKDSIQ
jgi:predicted histone-like DNA-binding protein